MLITLHLRNISETNSKHKLHLINSIILSGILNVKYLIQHGPITTHMLYIFRLWKTAKSQQSWCKSLQMGTITTFSQGGDILLIRCGKAGIMVLEDVL